MPYLLHHQFEKICRIIVIFVNAGIKNEELGNMILLALKSYLLLLTSFQAFNDAETQNIPILIMTDVQFHIINTRRSQRPLNKHENKHSGFTI